MTRRRIPYTARAAAGTALFAAGVASSSLVVGLTAAAGAALVVLHAIGREAEADKALRAAERHKANAIAAYQRLNTYNGNLERRLAAYHEHPSTKDPET